MTRLEVLREIGLFSHFGGIRQAAEEMANGLCTEAGTCGGKTCTECFERWLIQETRLEVITK